MAPKPKHIGKENAMENGGESPFRDVFYKYLETHNLIDHSISEILHHGEKCWNQLTEEKKRQFLMNLRNQKTVTKAKEPTENMHYDDNEEDEQLIFHGNGSQEGMCPQKKRKKPACPKKRKKRMCCPRKKRKRNPCKKRKPRCPKKRRKRKC